jgi:phosphoglycolate phosphatase
LATIGCRDKTFANIEALIFDKDGTLEDSQTFLRTVGQQRSRLIDAKVPGVGDPLLMAFGIAENTLDPTGLMAVGSRRENEIAAAAYVAETGRSWFDATVIAKAAFDEVDQHFQKIAETSPLFAGSLEVLKFLQDAGLKLAILSADSTEGVKAFVERHQLGDYIQLSMGVEQEQTKPDPALFVQTCQALGVNPAFTLMVGDSAGDIEMAQQAGAAGTMGISWGATAANLEKADVVISQLDEIHILPA